MLKLLQIFLLSLLLAPFTLQAQSRPSLPGAGAAALGEAAVTLSNAWAVQNNIGALATVEETSLVFGYSTRFHLQELTSFGCMAAMPLRQGVAAASFSRFGTGAYSLQEFGLGYSHQISFMSLGLRANYLQQSIEGLGSQGAIVLEAGGKAQLMPKLHFAAHAYNLSLSRMSRHTEDYIPVLLKAGIAYLPADNIQLLLQTLKELDHPARFSAGLEYGIVEGLQLRTGIMTKPVVAAFGLGFNPGNFVFDYAFRHQNTIGVSHHISIGYSFTQAK